MHSRPLYLDRITPHLGNPLIKVLTGMRRTGKSALLALVRDHLIERGTTPAQICWIDKEDLAFDHIRDYQQLAEHVLATADDGLQRRNRSYHLCRPIVRAALPDGGTSEAQL